MLLKQHAFLKNRGNKTQLRFKKYARVKDKKKMISYLHRELRRLAIRLEGRQCTFLRVLHIFASCFSCTFHGPSVPFSGVSSSRTR